MAVQPVIHATEVRPGSLILFDGRHCKLRGFERCTDGLVSVLDFGGELLRVPAADMFATVRLNGPPTEPDRLEMPDSSVWHALSAQERERLERRARHLLLAETGSERGLPELDRVEGILDPRYDPRTVSRHDRVTQLSKDLRAAGESSSSTATLYRQLDQFTRAGILGLIHGNRHIRLGAAGVEADVRDALQEFLDRQPSKAKVNLKVLAALAHTHLIECGFTPDFGARTLAGILGEMTRGKALHREAKSRDNRSDIVGRTYSPLPADRPGQSVLIDATATTMHPWFPHVGTAEAYILTAIDVYTRMVVALRVLAGPPNSRDVAMLLWDMGRPQVTRAGWPYEFQLIRGLPRLVAVTTRSSSIQSTRPKPVGTKLGVRPAFVVMDHGRENESLHVLSAAARNGVTLIYCPPGGPWAKGIVESVHRAIDQVQALFLESGYKGASVANHPKRAEKSARLTIGDLQDALWSYFLGVYNNTEHTGLRNSRNPAIRSTPQQTLEEYLLTVGEIAIPTDPWRVIDFLSSEPRSLQDYGINLNGLVYQSDDLMDIASLVQPGVAAKPHFLDVRYDRYDLSRVFVQHPITRAWLTVPVVIPGGSTAAPFSEALLQAAIRRTEAGARGLTPTERLRALSQIQLDFSRGIYADVREKREAAFEAARRDAHAHDLEDAPAEYRGLVAGRTQPPDDDPDAPEDIVDLTQYGYLSERTSE